MDLSRIIEIDFQKCYLSLKKSFKLIIAITLTFFLIGTIIAFFFIRQNDEYKSTTSVYSIVYGSFTDSADSIQAMFSYADIVKSYKVAERAEVLLGDTSINKNDIYKMISAEYNTSTYNYSSMIYIHALSDSRAKALSVSNAVAEAFVLEVANLTGQDDIQILDKAHDAVICYNATSMKLKTILIVTVLGFFLSCFFIVMKEILSLKMFTPKDATVYGKLDIIGVIPDFKTEKNQ